MFRHRQNKKKENTGIDEGKKYNCQCGESFSSVEELNDHNHKAH